MEAERRARKTAVYILFNDMNSPYRFRATKFVMDQGHVPLYPAIVGDFFAVQSKPRPPDHDRMLRECDEVWVFGDVSSRMQDRIILAKRLGKKVKAFHILGGQFLEKERQDQIRTF